MKLIHRPHVPTVLVCLGGVVALLVLYHLCLGRSRRR